MEIINYELPIPSGENQPLTQIIATRISQFLEDHFILRQEVTGFLMVYPYDMDLVDMDEISSLMNQNYPNVFWYADYDHNGESEGMLDLTLFLKPVRLSSKEKYQIAIDGPAGAGKSTIARILARQLGIAYLDTGEMYRAITYKLIQSEVNFDNLAAMEKLVNETNITYQDHAICIDGTVVKEELRSKEVTDLVSFVSSLKFVRDKLVRLQQAIAKHRSCVLDGRDIGTVVLPNADFKFFLTASPEERARRRFVQNKNFSKEDYDRVLADIIRRDHYDSTRKISPLIRSKDALLVDTTCMTINQVVYQMLSIIKEKMS